MSFPAISQVSNSGIAMPISLVRFCSSLPSTGKAPTFFERSNVRLMPDHAHNVRLIAVLIQGVLHRLAIQGERLVLLAPGLIPQIQCPIQRSRFNPYHAVADHIFAGNHIVSVFTPAAEALPSVLA